MKHTPTPTPTPEDIFDAGAKFQWLAGMEAPSEIPTDVMVSAVKFVAARPEITTVILCRDTMATPPGEYWWLEAKFADGTHHLYCNSAPESEEPSPRWGLMVDLTPDLYTAYVQACEAENLNPHTRQQWIVHGKPQGPLR